MVPNVTIIMTIPTRKIKPVKINDKIPHKHKTSIKIERLEKIFPSRIKKFFNSFLDSIKKDVFSISAPLNKIIF